MNRFSLSANSCSVLQVSLLFPESDSYNFALADTDGFVSVRNLSKALTRSVITETVEWIRDERFDAIFYPEVRESAMCTVRSA